MLTEAKFKAIICMIRGGASDEDIKSSQGINEKTLAKIKKSNESYDTYRKLHGSEVANMNRAKSKPVAQPQSVTVQTTYYVTQKMDKMTDLLTGISAKLAHMMEAVDAMMEIWKGENK